jgi:hypothetical protein
MVDLRDIADQVVENCAVMDARHAGGFSICGLALRLRDLFKWEQGLDPWVERESGEVLDWIGRREEKWEAVAEADLRPIRVSGKAFDPFDEEGVNAILEPRGYLYGAGLAGGLVPVFFLARIEETRRMGDVTVYVLGRELARGLLTLPALTRDHTVLLRRETARRFLWDEILYAGEGGGEAIRYALGRYGLSAGRPGEIPPHLDAMVRDELEVLLRHELGEFRDTTFDRTTWRAVIAAFPHTPVELLARAVKDLLADTHDAGTLRYIIDGERHASLGFYTAFLDGLRKALFPEMAEAFSGFRESGDWDGIERALRAARERASHYAGVITEAYEQGRARDDLPRAEAEIEERLLAPLGLPGKSGNGP